jgi:hypothetical protein
MATPPEVKSGARDDRLSAPGLQSLKYREREIVRKQMLEDARNSCHETRAAYVACARGGLSAPAAPDA